jgi:ADP-ribosyl-[dinitrogen reductase] hydrolase
MDLKKLGCLYGLAVGDALGATTEFSKPKVPPYPELLKGPQVNIVGGGPFIVRPGQTTDDTQMAVCLSKAIIENGMIYDENVVSKHYIKWRDDLFDGGTTTLASIEHLVNGVQPQLSGYETWICNEKKSSGNGSLMRCAPIGVAFSNLPYVDIIDISLRDSIITHFDFRCQFACAIFNCLIADFVNDILLTPHITAKKVLQLTYSLLLTKYESFHIDIQEAMIDIEKDIDAAFNSKNPRVYGEEHNFHIIKTQGFVRIAFRLSLWYLANKISFEESLIDIINRGGDSDTNGAIVGALLGAYYGIEHIPLHWLERIDHAFDGDSNHTFGEVYHPKHMFKLAN